MFGNFEQCFLENISFFDSTNLVISMRTKRV